MSEVLWGVAAAAPLLLMDCPEAEGFCRRRPVEEASCYHRLVEEAFYHHSLVAEVE
jgi:hypothetical protein